MRTSYEFIQELKEQRVFKVGDGADGKYHVIKKVRAERSKYESTSLVNPLIKQGKRIKSAKHAVRSYKTLYLKT